MSYASDVYAQLGSELELYDALLSAASTPIENKSTFDAQSVTVETSNTQDEKVEDHKKPVREILAAVRPADGSRSLPSRKTLLSLLDKLDATSQHADGSTVPHLEELKIVALSRLVVATYAVALDDLLQDASKLEDETWYWTEIEESTRRSLSYLVQTLPVRLFNVITEVLELAAGTATNTFRNTIDSASVKKRDDDASLPSKVKSLDKNTVRAALRNILDTPNLVTSMLFPYAFRLEKDTTFDNLLAERENQQEKVATLRAQLDANSVAGDQLSSVSSKKSKTQRVKALRSTMLTLTPTYLVKHEARCKRRGLINEKNRLAEKLGQLALQHKSLAEEAQELGVTASEPGSCSNVVLGHLNAKLQVLVESLVESGDKFDVKAGAGTGDVKIDMEASLTPETMLGTLRLLLKEGFLKQTERTQRVLSPDVFGQPSVLVQRWPKLVFYPVGLLLLGRYLSNNWNGIEAKLKEAQETIQSFLISWVWQPCVELLNTVRHGNEGSVIMSRESLASDLQSLERMVTDFTADKYGTSGAELQAVAARVREGDLTQVLKVYEAEMKSPVKSMVSGSLFRSLLIQIQKAKVDLEVAMSGIDKLLKSQQLLFGAVGIAPALGVLYISQNYIRSKLFRLSSSRSESSGRGYQMRAWEAMRRVDRLLSSPHIVSPAASGVGRDEKRLAKPEKSDKRRDNLAQGLLLLDLSTLRSASGPLLMSLSHGKKATARRLQRQFLQDIRDLESGERSAVERMWRSWGSSVLRLPSS
ncbi:related to NCA2 - control of mitochondrial synthesis of Atp6p and Atp8p [Melanopsichium pennsylvanicum]|uniref:Related to NCA2 - control of mitochondrial synthesis of Atp6p and Atp8p n=2 Tax=Melanopsichium pennsylvanicum TaxID=63383 RepID=A0AAJ4XJA9_9BASI|nr:related to NCA2-control of mitochondrial synthesis of Atp6p and Atp8p [Melanopsichium pennsylvanicum 4]SNX83067.1 related to NCA2 - control of mitochondrial synthesis of Atp6p and Atp8p [Melanopsichium pennsylvanicum]